MSDILLYDTTLRDGTQREGISSSVDDKLKIARRLDEFGVHYIEGGWPGSNPKDAAFFQRARQMKFKQAKIAAFGFTLKKGARPEERLQYPGAALRRDAGGHPGRQKLGSARHRRAGDHAWKKTWR